VPAAIDRLTARSAAVWHFAIGERHVVALDPVREAIRAVRRR
jgi:hypothetical protein